MLQVTPFTRLSLAVSFKFAHNMEGFPFGLLRLVKEKKKLCRLIQTDQFPLLSPTAMSC